MSQRNSFDIIIAGAGASGLSLLWNIMHHPGLESKRILLTDRSLEPIRNKTWCFWAAESVPFQKLVFHQWKKLEVRTQWDSFSESLRTYSYYCVRSDHFAKTIFEKAKNKPGITFLKADIEGFRQGKTGAEMVTSSGVFQSDILFQSALKPPGFHKLKLDLSLKQHFLGWHIKTNKSVFDPEKAVLMDFDLPQKNGVTFVYVLPFSKNEALIEYTLFSEALIRDDEYKEGLSGYIESRFKLKPSDYSIEYAETGEIPMEDRRYPAQYAPDVWNMGTMGGLTKPSTGYTFTRIQEHTAKIALALAKGQPPPHNPLSPYRFRVYDMMLLYNLHHHHNISLKIFHDLFKNNRFDDIFHFLGEKTTFREELKILASVPSYPFLRSIYKMKHRIFTGA